MKRDKDGVILLVISIFCIIMILITSIKSSFISPLRTGVGIFLSPLQNGINVAGKAFYNSIEERKALKNAYEENKILKEKIDELLFENNNLEVSYLEAKRLNELLELKEEYKGYASISAKVIAKDSGRWFKVFRINKGKNDGIEVDMNVIAKGGLVGIVSDVGNNYATVRSIIDDLSRVSAMSLGSSNTCIVAGDLLLYENALLRLLDIDINSDIKDGDKIVTSNISSKFLPNILIGFAKDIKVDNSRLTKSGYIVPVVSFDTFQEVLVLTKKKDLGE